MDSAKMCVEDFCYDEADYYICPRTNRVTTQGRCRNCYEEAVHRVAREGSYMVEAMKRDKIQVTQYLNVKANGPKSIKRPFKEKTRKETEE